MDRVCQSLIPVVVTDSRRVWFEFKQTLSEKEPKTCDGFFGD